MLQYFYFFWGAEKEKKKPCLTYSTLISVDIKYLYMHRKQTNISDWTHNIASYVVHINGSFYELLIPENHMTFVFLRIE